MNETLEDGEIPSEEESELVIPESPPPPLPTTENDSPPTATVSSDPTPVIIPLCRQSLSESEIITISSSSNSSPSSVLDERIGKTPPPLLLSLPSKTSPPSNATIQPTTSNNTLYSSVSNNHSGSPPPLNSNNYHAVVSESSGINGDVDYRFDTAALTTTSTSKSADTETVSFEKASLFQHNNPNNSNTSSLRSHSPSTSYFCSQQQQTQQQTVGTTPVSRSRRDHPLLQQPPPPLALVTTTTLRRKQTPLLPSYPPQGPPPPKPSQDTVVVPTLSLVPPTPSTLAMGQQMSHRRNVSPLLSSSNPNQNSPNTMQQPCFPPHRQSPSVLISPNPNVFMTSSQQHPSAETSVINSSTSNIIPPPRPFGSTTPGITADIPSAAVAHQSNLSRNSQMAQIMNQECADASVPSEPSLSDLLNSLIVANNQQQQQTPQHQQPLNMNEISQQPSTLSSVMNENNMDASSSTSPGPWQNKPSNTSSDSAATNPSSVTTRSQSGFWMKMAPRKEQRLAQSQKSSEVYERLNEIMETTTNSPRDESKSAVGSVSNDESSLETMTNQYTDLQKEIEIIKSKEAAVAREEAKAVAEIGDKGDDSKSDDVHRTEAEETENREPVTDDEDEILPAGKIKEKMTEANPVGGDDEVVGEDDELIEMQLRLAALESTLGKSSKKKPTDLEEGEVVEDESPANKKDSKNDRDKLKKQSRGSKNRDSSPNNNKNQFGDDCVITVNLASYHQRRRLVEMSNSKSGSGSSRTDKARRSQSKEKLMSNKEKAAMVPQKRSKSPSTSKSPSRTSSSRLIGGTGTEKSHRLSMSDNNRSTSASGVRRGDESSIPTAYATSSSRHTTSSSKTSRQSSALAHTSSSYYRNHRHESSACSSRQSARHSLNRARSVVRDRRESVRKSSYKSASAATKPSSSSSRRETSKGTKSSTTKSTSPSCCAFGGTIDRMTAVAKETKVSNEAGSGDQEVQVRRREKLAAWHQKQREKILNLPPDSDTQFEEFIKMVRRDTDEKDVVENDGRVSSPSSNPLPDNCLSAIEAKPSQPNIPLPPLPAAILPHQSASRKFCGSREYASTGDPTAGKLPPSSSSPSTITITSHNSQQSQQTGGDNFTICSMDLDDEGSDGNNEQEPPSVSSSTSTTMLLMIPPPPPPPIVSEQENEEGLLRQQVLQSMLGSSAGGGGGPNGNLGIAKRKKLSQFSKPLTGGGDMASLSSMADDEEYDPEDSIGTLSLSSQYSSMSTPNNNNHTANYYSAGATNPSRIHPEYVPSPVAQQLLEVTNNDDDNNKKTNSSSSSSSRVVLINPNHLSNQLHHDHHRRHQHHLIVQQNHQDNLTQRDMSPSPSPSSAAKPPPTGGHGSPVTMLLSENRRLSSSTPLALNHRHRNDSPTATTADVIQIDDNDNDDDDEKEEEEDELELRKKLLLAAVSNAAAASASAAFLPSQTVNNSTSAVAAASSSSSSSLVAVIRPESVSPERKVIPPPPKLSSLEKMRRVNPVVIEMDTSDEEDPSDNQKGMKKRKAKTKKAEPSSDPSSAMVIQGEEILAKYLRMAREKTDKLKAAKLVGDGLSTLPTPLPSKSNSSSRQGSPSPFVLAAKSTNPMKIDRTLSSTKLSSASLKDPQTIVKETVENSTQSIRGLSAEKEIADGQKKSGDSSKEASREKGTEDGDQKENTSKSMNQPLLAASTSNKKAGSRTTTKTKKDPLAYLTERLSSCEEEIGHHRQQIEEDRTRLNSLESILVRTQTDLKTELAKQKELRRQLKIVGTSIANKRMMVTKMSHEQGVVKLRLGQNEQKQTVYETQWREISQLARNYGDPKLMTSYGGGGKKDGISLSLDNDGGSSLSATNNKIRKFPSKQQHSTSASSSSSHAKTKLASIAAKLGEEREKVERKRDELERNIIRLYNNPYSSESSLAFEAAGAAAYPVSDPSVYSVRRKENPSNWTVDSFFPKFMLGGSSANQEKREKELDNSVPSTFKFTVKSIGRLRSDLFSIYPVFREYRLLNPSKEEERDRLCSLTYCHKLDPFVPLCNWELFGICADKHCPWQHSREYMLSENEKILDIVNHSPATKDASTFKTYLEAAKKLLTEDLPASKPLAVKLRLMLNEMREANPVLDSTSKLHVQRRSDLVERVAGRKRRQLER